MCARFLAEWIQCRLVVILPNGSPIVLGIKCFAKPRKSRESTADKSYQNSTKLPFKQTIAANGIHQHAQSLQGMSADRKFEVRISRGCGLGISNLKFAHACSRCPARGCLQ